VREAVRATIARQIDRYEDIVARQFG
jgi:hypothetical protein